MSAWTKVSAALSIGLLGALLGQAQPLRAQAQSLVTAIDTLLDPDGTMIEHATAANERLLKVFPKGFALGKTHQGAFEERTDEIDSFSCNRLCR